MIRIAKFLLKHKTKIIIVFLMIVGSFLRLYRLEDLMVYLGDEGRDMLIVMDIIQGKNLPLIGPPTSVGELYLGPIYYYFITPFAWIFKMNPIGPAVFVAMLGILTIPLLYKVSQKFFNSSAVGIMAAAFFTLSPLIIKFSRSSWNPNPMPFFSLLLLLSLLNLLKTKRPKHLFLAIFSFSVILQLHYMVVVIAPFLIYFLWKISKDIKDKKALLLGTFIFIMMLSPLLIFDLKHDFVNTNGFLAIFKERSNSGFNLFDLLSRSRDRLRQLFSLFFGFAERSRRTNLIIIITMLISLYDLIIKKNKLKLLFFGYFFWSLLTLGFYRKSVYPHYLGFLFPIPAIIVANSINIVSKKKLILKLAGIMIFFSLSLNMLKLVKDDLMRPPVLNVKLVKKIVRLIEKESGGKLFNFALLAKNNYDSSYRFFFKLWDIPAVYQTEISDQLIIVCEDKDICKPEGNPKWEIALFDAAYDGKIKKVGYWEPDQLIEVFKFVPDE